MSARIKRYQEAGRRAAEFILSHQRPDGSFTGKDFQEDVYHKTAYSLSVAGFFAEAHRLLDWMARHDLMPSGELRHYYSPGRMQVYKDAWACIGAHRLGRFDISYPVMTFISTFQAPCGGFPCESKEDPWVRSLTTAWAGHAALYLGRLTVATLAGDCLIEMLRQQPDPNKFYFMMSLDGRLATPDWTEHCPCIDAAKPAQQYWEAGIAIIFLCRLYQATGERHYLDGATKLFEFKLRCQPDGFAHGNAGKDGLGAAIYFTITGDERAKAAACSEADFLCDTQQPDGSWAFDYEPDNLVIRLDHAAEYNIWLQEIAAALASSEE